MSVAISASSFHCQPFPYVQVQVQVATPVYICIAAQPKHGRGRFAEDYRCRQNGLRRQQDTCSQVSTHHAAGDQGAQAHRRASGVAAAYSCSIGFQPQRCTSECTHVPCHHLELDEERWIRSESASRHRHQVPYGLSRAIAARLAQPRVHREGSRVAPSVR